MKSKKLVLRVIALAMLLVSGFATPTSAGEPERKIPGSILSTPILTVEGRTFHVYYHLPRFSGRILNNKLAESNCQLATPEQAAAFEKDYGVLKKAIKNPPKLWEDSPEGKKALAEGKMVRYVVVRTDELKVGSLVRVSSRE